MTLVLLLTTFLYRKRILATFARLLMKGAYNYAFEETTAIDESGTKTRKLTLKPEAERVLGVVTPALVQQAVRTIQIKTPKSLPINPITGQLDFMAPVLQKVASGRKIGFEDFLPLIMDKAMPYLEGFLGGMKGGTTSKETLKLPEHLSHPSK